MHRSSGRRRFASLDDTTCAKPRKVSDLVIHSSIRASGENASPSSARLLSLAIPCPTATADGLILPASGQGLPIADIMWVCGEGSGLSRYSASCSCPRTWPSPEAHVVGTTVAAGALHTRVGTTRTPVPTIITGDARGDSPCNYRGSTRPSRRHVSASSAFPHP